MTTKSKKIIVLASTFPRWKDDSIPAFVHDQLTFLKLIRPDWEFFVLAPHDEGAESFETTEYGEVHRFRYFYPIRYQRLVYPAIMPNLQKNAWLYLQVPFLLIFEIFALLKLVRHTKPDFIYSHWFVPQGIVGGIVGLMTGVSHVYTSHSSDVMIAKKVQILGPFMVRFFTQHSRRVTVVSKRSYEKLKGFFSAKKWISVSRKVKIIPMGVDTSAFSTMSASEPEQASGFDHKNKNVVLFIGRLAEKKGVKYLIDAISEYRKNDPDVLLIVAGDGPLRADLTDQAIAFGIQDYVKFVGYVSGDKKLELFSLCDVLVLPSVIAADGDAEGMPVVLMEGLASGKLCVATDVSGADDILEHGVDGFLIRPKSSDDILEILLEIRAMDTKTKQLVSDNAMSKSKHFDWIPIVEKHVQHLFQD